MSAKSNADEVAAKLRRKLEAALESAGAGLYLGGSLIATESIRRAPIDFGVLRDSHYATIPRLFPGGDVQMEVGVGGAAKEYAVPQHERLDYQHEEGEAKYLENAIQAKAKQAASMIRRSVDRGLRTGKPERIVRSTVPEVPT
jgi:hypothetical protein